VILEAASAAAEPVPGFLSGLRKLCTQYGAVLIFDEMITGFRYHLHGAQAEFGVTPDLSTFGKALGNGFAIAALAGRRELMELGGFPEGRERVFTLSTTTVPSSTSLPRPAPSWRYIRPMTSSARSTSRPAASRCRTARNRRARPNR